MFILFLESMKAEGRILECFYCLVLIFVNTSLYYQVVRAKVVLLASQGLENKEIGKQLDLPRQIVSKWRKRFFEQRLAGLQDLPRQGRPCHFSP